MQSSEAPGKSKGSYLVMLTKQFPFHHGEQYVAHELNYLAASFEKVFLYPHDHFTKGDQIKFELPSNVVVCDLNQKVISANKFKVLASFLSSFIFEFWYTHDRLWMLRNLRYFYSIYATQFALGRGLITFLEGEKIDQKRVVFYSYWFSSAALCLSILKKHRLIHGYVSRAHSLDLYHEAWGFLNDVIRVLPFRNLKQKFVDKLFVITEHGKNFLDTTSKVKSEIEVRYLGVKDYGLNPGPGRDIFTVVTCSGIDENKRIHKLGESLSRIGRPVKWIHFGDGPLRQDALKSVTHPAVNFELRGQTPNEEVRNFYRSSEVDLFVNISKVEGLPVTIMEAISHGIPVLSTICSGTPEAVIDRSNGFRIPNDFSDELIDSVLTSALDNRELLSAMRIESRKLYESKFNADKNYEAFAIQLLSYLG